LTPLHWRIDARSDVETMNQPLTFTKVKLLLAAFGLAFAASHLAHAGSFTVTPVRIFLQPTEKAVSLTVVNEGDKPLVLQTEIFQWAQNASGADQLTESEDLIVAPPIVRLAPNARQVIRLARLGAADPNRQLTYRVIVREVPELTQAPAGQIQLPVAIAFSLPIFVTPPTAKRRLDCELARGTGSALKLQCSNVGTAYAQLRTITLLQGMDEVHRVEGGVYVLPGANREIELTPTKPLPEGPTKVMLQFDDNQTQEFQQSLPRASANSSSTAR
jgi:fimbrial chaperone protein